MTNTEQIKGIIERLGALAKYLDVDAELIEITNEEEKTFAPDFGTMRKEAEIIVRNLRSKKKWVEDYNKAT